MKRETGRMMASCALALAFSLSTARNAQAQDAKNPYPSMAPIEKYLMDRDAEIALARSAAPSSISRDATVVILGKNGYETAVEGTNGFICIVERGWMNSFNSPEFWSPKTRGAECFNPPAARTVVPYTYFRTKLVLAGKSKAEMKESIKTAMERKELPALEAGAMCSSIRTGHIGLRSPPSRQPGLLDRGSQKGLVPRARCDRTCAVLHTFNGGGISPSGACFSPMWNWFFLVSGSPRLIFPRGAGCLCGCRWRGMHHPLISFYRTRLV